MNGQQKVVALDPVGLDRVDEHTHPRVLFLHFWRSQRSGLEMAGSTLVGCFADEGWPVSPFPFATVSYAMGFSEIVRGIPARASAKFRFLKRLVSALPGCDVVHLSVGSQPDLIRLALPALVLTRFFGKKIVLQFISPEIEEFLDRWSGWFHSFLKMADRIVVGSRYLQKVAGRAKLKVTVLAGPVDTTGINHRTISILQPRILTDCLLEPGYNVSCLLSAFRMVKQKYPRSELTIVGDGSQMAALQQKVRDEHIYGVDFVGSVPESRIAEYYHNADLFLNSSSVDESPSSIVRAFAAGLPVVTTDADGLLHMVRDRVNAMVVPVNDQVGLADRIIELIENSELTTKLSAQGKSEVRKYTWSRLRQDWVNLYTKLAP